MMGRRSARPLTAPACALRRLGLKTGHSTFQSFALYPCQLAQKAYNKKRYRRGGKCYAIV